eukprot:TRINITY_DN9949_c0_g1_i1.p1 TRINITY_DN9949_c0_g1~~TRINITY_DN9949_c0_g1_i1.p1  ORF type:complete len:260 (+),score=55.33 TRINITY_DN9949_c0_g1_i1:111-782(+)
MRVGVLAIQGSFLEHIEKLRLVTSQNPKYHGTTIVEVRNASDLNELNGLIIPGGESTTLCRVLERSMGFRDSVQDFISTPNKVVWGTCAGLILLSEKLAVPDERVTPFGGLKVTVDRNSYGRQIDSFSGTIFVKPGFLPGSSTPTETSIFIRAPRIVEVGEEVEILATRKVQVRCNGGEGADEVVGVLAHKRLMGTSFHPELMPGHRWHEAFLELCQQNRETK